ncbi:MAG: tetratricopeptide repeat protein [Lachnospiraceae bacterium]|nr:tetratricopeptide repeat protein [Lachnospiraceae bacterium]
MLDEKVINEKYENCKKLVSKKDFKEARDSLKELISLVEPLYVSPLKKYYSFNHIIESYYYAFFMKDDSELNYTFHNINGYYRLLGYVYMQLERYDDSIVAYNKALNYNPVDLDTLFQLGELYKKQGNVRGLKKLTFELYDYCCSRATIAHFYRNLGYYYLENKKPQEAMALYIYSNIFYETKQAVSELEFLKKSLYLTDEYEDSLKNNIKGLQKILEDNNIPTGPNPDTIGITYRVGEIERDNFRYENAFDCFSMVYDLTLDNEVKKEIDKLEIKINKNQ